MRFCGKCSAFLSDIKTKENKTSQIRAVFALIILAVIGYFIYKVVDFFNFPSDTASVAETTQITGINTEAFYKTLEERMDLLCKDNDLIISYEAAVNNVSGSGFAHVKLYLRDTISWEALTDLGKKEFVHTMGSVMDKVALDTQYPNADLISTNTRIFSPTGLELAERDIRGKVILK